MTWYAAHIIMAVKYKKGVQRRFPVWENVVLIHAASEEQAFAKADAIGLRDASDDDGAMHWGGRLARWEFIGVRKLTECALLAERPSDSDEVTYHELEFNSAAAVERYAKGQAVEVRHVDQIRLMARPESQPKARRKRA